jgi:methylated-DNA-[protein]-cysteine S-methyltransferase
MTMEASFTVETPVADFAVTAADGAVARIDLNRRARRGPEGDFEHRVARELEEYAAGGRTEFSFPVRPQGTEFDRTVWDAVARIPYGETATYGEIAAGLGKPGAARAVGTANGRNPVPPVIPCHRVVAAGGGLGGYGGGLPLKRRLLDLETRRRPMRRGGGVATALTFALALLAASACGKPDRPAFGVEENANPALDTVGPSIEWLYPPDGDTVFFRSQDIFVRLQIRDTNGIASVDAFVQGEPSFGFGFSQFRPTGSIFTVTYPVQVPPDVTVFMLTVLAVDELTNSTRAQRTFEIQ